MVTLHHRKRQSFDAVSKRCGRATFHVTCGSTMAEARASLGRELAVGPTDYFRLLETFAKMRQDVETSGIISQAAAPAASSSSAQLPQVAGLRRQGLPVVAPTLKPLQGHFKTQIMNAQASHLRAHTPRRTRHQKQQSKFPMPVLSTAPVKEELPPPSVHRHAHVGFFISDSWAQRSPRLESRTSSAIGRASPTRASSPPRSAGEMLLAANRTLLDIRVSRESCAATNWGWHPLPPSPRRPGSVASPRGPSRPPSRA